MNMIKLNALRLAVRRSSAWTLATARRAELYRCYTTASRVCPACSAPLPTALPTCPKCFHIEPLPSSSTYFDIFGLDSRPNPFKIDTRELKRRFLQAQTVCHPDAWSGKDHKAQDMAATQSSLVNEAYKTLQSPVLRAQYILTQQGYPPQETDKLTDRELVMEIMEAREGLDEAESSDDVEPIRSQNAEKMKEVIDKIERLLEEQKWAEASDAVVELKYLEGIDTAAKGKLELLSQ